MKIDYNYIFISAEVERLACHLPRVKELLNSETHVVNANSALYSGKYDISKIRLWIPQFPAYENTFISNLRHSLSLRKKFPKKWQDFDSYLEYIYEEYVSWLVYMKTQQLPDNAEVKMLKKYFLSFFSTYNHAYFLNGQQQKTIRQYHYNLNPFIVFWFRCQPLAQVLKVPQLTIFLPQINVLCSKIANIEERNVNNDTTT